MFRILNRIRNSNRSVRIRSTLDYKFLKGCFSGFKFAQIIFHIVLLLLYARGGNSFSPLEVIVTLEHCFYILINCTIIGIGLLCVPRRSLIICVEFLNLIICLLMFFILLNFMEYNAKGTVMSGEQESTILNSSTFYNVTLAEKFGLLFQKKLDATEALVSILFVLILMSFMSMIAAYQPCKITCFDKLLLLCKRYNSVPMINSVSSVALSVLSPLTLRRSTDTWWDLEETMSKESFNSLRVEAASDEENELDETLRIGSVMTNMNDPNEESEQDETLRMGSVITNMNDSNEESEQDETLRMGSVMTINMNDPISSTSLLSQISDDYENEINIRYSIVKIMIHEIHSAVIISCFTEYFKKRGFQAIINNLYEICEKAGLVEQQTKEILEESEKEKIPTNEEKKYLFNSLDDIYIKYAYLRRNMRRELFNRIFEFDAQYIKEEQARRNNLSIQRSKSLPSVSSTPLTTCARSTTSAANINLRYSSESIKTDDKIDEEKLRAFEEEFASLRKSVKHRVLLYAEKESINV